MKQVEYIINEKHYVQRPLVLAQVRQLFRVTSTMSLPESLDIATIIAVMADQAPAAVACVLRDENGAIPWMRREMLGATPIITVDEEKFADYTMQVADGLTAEEAAQVIEDFFECNPVASLLERLGGLQKKFMVAIAGALKPGNPLDPSFASSPMETSPRETPSAEATPE